MDIRELRIGNNVHFDGYDDCIVEGIGLDTVIINTYDVIDEVFISQLKPIELTEDWLIYRFGFEKELDGSYFKNDISIFLDKRLKTNLYLYSDRKFEWFGYGCKINYIHQLQNLYFALTGNELCLNK